jgi:hypothetical protein
VSASDGEDEVTQGQGLFRRIASRPFRSERDEREDRLTEIFAAVLRHRECASLAPYLVRGWLEYIAAERTRLPRECGAALLLNFVPREREPAFVETQTAIREDRRRPDMTLDFTTTARRRFMVWVEAKIDAPPAGGQLRAYVNRVNRESARGHGLVILAAPRARYGTFDRRQVPEDVAEIPWEKTAELLHSYQWHSEREQLLVDELYKYMQEEDLVDPPKLDSDHIRSLELHSDAERAADAVYDAADSYLRRHGEEISTAEGSVDKTRHQLIRAYELRPNFGELYRVWWWAFLDGRRLFGGRRQVPVIAAGLYRHGWMSPPTIELFREQRFVEHSAAHRNWKWPNPRLMQTIDLDNVPGLMSAETVEQQGDALGEWIKQAFEAARAVLESPEVTSDLAAEQPK